MMADEMLDIQDGYNFTETAKYANNDNYINKVPEEVLQYIFAQLIPYRDLNSCRLVCKEWYRLIEDVKPQIYNDFTRSLITSRIKWESYQFRSKTDITNRYAHSATRHGNFMYVFGGFTQNCTAFNDLWALDLSNRKWKRIIAKGTNPCPKGCATLLTYKDTLVLFGGRHTPITYTMHTSYAALHLYCIKANKWTLVSSSEVPRPPLAGHSATIHGDFMVVFGGLEHQICTNKVRVLDLVSMEWFHPIIKGPEPHARYNHSQVALDTRHLIIMGGCFSPSFKVLQDMWLLQMETDPWTWHKIDIGTNNVLNSIWCHPVCKVGSYVVGFTSNMHVMNPTKYASWFSWRDGRYIEHSISGNDELPSLYHIRRRTGRRLGPLLSMYVIDTSEMLHCDGFPLKWYHHGITCSHTPVDTILYSVVPGNAEIILFGGMQKYTDDEANANTIGEEVNFLHFMKSETKII